MLEQDLRKSLERAEKYLSIVENLERTGKYTEVEYNWLSKNCRLLDEEMNELNFSQLETGMVDGYGKPLMRIRKVIVKFPNFLKVGFPMEERYIFSVIKGNLNGYIQKINELIENPQKLKDIFKDKKEREYKIVEFDKGKIIEILVLGFYVTSLFLILNNDLFIFGFILNLISVIAILIVSFIKWGKVGNK